MEEVIKLLLDYGPVGLLALLVITGILVPKSFYDREVKRGDLATESNVKNADSLKSVADALKVVSDSNVGLKTALAGIQEELSRQKEEFRLYRLSKGGDA